MTDEQLVSTIRIVPDYPIKGIQFFDVTTLFKNPAAYEEVIRRICDIYKDKGITKVAGIESRGFIAGAAVAARLGAGFVPIRKPGKLPAQTISESYSKEYGTDTIEIHADARQKFPLVPNSDTCKLLVREAIAQINAVSRTVETYRAEMDRLASQLPEYETVMAMTGVGKSMGPQLMAEIGDLRRFVHQKSLVGFAGTDPIKDDSGDKVTDSKPSSKRGSPYLRKTLFVIMSILLQLQPQDDPVYQFMDKKRSEGKKYYVYMTAGMTKFLRIYYGKVRDCLKEKGLWEHPSSDQVNPCLTGVGNQPLDCP